MKGAKAGTAKGGKLEVTIGTMIETPRAALRADEIAEEADFFSFGTNDLTQMTFGFSRDDVEGRMMSAYLELGLLQRNPFEVVDPDGVGELVRLGTERGRATRPDLKVGVCGEHGGDPAVDRHLLPGRSRLRQLLALPGADRPSGRRPGRPGRPTRREPVDDKKAGEPATKGRRRTARARTERRSAIRVQMASTTPKGQAPERKP